MSQQIQLTGGAKVRDLQDVIIGTSGVLSSLAFNVANGVPKLDSNGKILVAQLPNSVMEYKGVWNAATNSPTLTNGGAFNQGDVYLCDTAGTVNFGSGSPISFIVGDQAIYSGSVWQKAGGATGTVTSVAVTESGDSLNITGSPITTSGTINIGFNGTNLQYVNGAGNLTTFPILTGYVPYTGATQDVDLGAFSLNGKSLHIKGTAGNGHLGLKHQSAAATGSANESLIYADSLGDLSWQNANLYLSKFITSANSANRSYTFPNATCNIPDDSLVVHLAGTETITGAKTFSGYTTFTSTVDITSGLTFSNSGFTLVLQPPTLSVNRTVTLPNGTGTLALTSDLTGYLTAVTATSPLSSSGGTTPNITIAQATTSANGYLSSTDWNTFNNKQATITLTTTGTSGAATLIGATLNIPNYAPDLSGYVTLAGTQTITGAKTFSTYSKFDGGVILKNNVSASLAGYVGLSAYSASGNKGINIDFDTYSASFYFSGTLPYQYTFPAATGTIALVGGSGVGTVTSVAALTLGTTGTDLSSSVANSTTTPVITLNVPTASATNRGALSSADWTTFNNKQSALTNPVTGTGTTNYLPKFTGTSTIGNSIIQDATTYIDVAGYAFFRRGGKYVILNPNYNIANVYAELVSEEAMALSLSANGQTQHLYINTSGNISIGNTSNTYKLDVTGTGRFTSSLTAGGSSTFSAASTTLTADILTVRGGGGSGAFGFKVEANNGEDLFYTDNYTYNIIANPIGGNFLIGTTTNSGYKLDVNGTGRFSDTVTGNTSNAFYVNAISGNSYISYGLNGTTNAYTGLAGSAGAIVAGTSTGDLVLRTEGYNMFLGTNSNTSWALKLTASTGAATFSTSAFVGGFNLTSTYASKLGVYNPSLAANMELGTNTSTSGAIVSRLTSYNVNNGNSGNESSTNFMGIVSLETQLQGTNGGNFILKTKGDGGTLDTRLTLASTGAATFSSSVTATSFFESSDSRLKTLIHDNYQTKGIASITPKLYIKNGKVELGYYAQDFVGVLDSAVSKGSDDMLSLSYREVHTAKIYALEQRIKELETKLN